MTDLKDIVMKEIIEAALTEQPIYKFTLLIPEISCYSMSFEEIIVILDFDAFEKNAFEGRKHALKEDWDHLIDRNEDEVDISILGKMNPTHHQYNDMTLRCVDDVVEVRDISDIKIMAKKLSINLMN